MTVFGRVANRWIKSLKRKHDTLSDNEDYTLLTKKRNSINKFPEVSLQNIINDAFIESDDVDTSIEYFKSRSTYPTTRSMSNTAIRGLHLRNINMHNHALYI